MFGLSKVHRIPTLEGIKTIFRKLNICTTSKKESSVKNNFGKSTNACNIFITSVVLQIIIHINTLSIANADKLYIENQKELDKYYNNAIERFCLGKHGELICPERNQQKHSNVFAIRSSDNSIILYLKHNNKIFIFGRVDNSNNIIYSNIEHFSNLFKKPFCGIKKWPSYNNFEDAHNGGKNIFSDLSSCKMPNKPDNCIMIAYATWSNSIYFSRNENIMSPFPIWLIKNNINDISIISSENPNITIGEIKKTEHKNRIYATIKFYHTIDFFAINSNKYKKYTQEVYPYFDLNEGLKLPPSGLILNPICPLVDTYKVFYNKHGAVEYVMEPLRD